ncbi:hypothetical protein [Aridibaculum aurantiacum]|uniref:hypothetical protein n=1 Tax=Aridibaculum aurantiacum TaxID=2810307 RepID=UPI001A96573A|nr:hypothetical protein [Aridibaculum aurantiacum]
MKQAMIVLLLTATTLAASAQSQRTKKQKVKQETVEVGAQGNNASATGVVRSTNKGANGKKLGHYKNGKATGTRWETRTNANGKKIRVRVD